MFLTSIFLVGMNAAGELKPGQQQFPLTSQGWTLGAGFSVVISLSWPGEPENCKNSNKIASKRKRRHFNWSRVPGRRKCKSVTKLSIMHIVTALSRILASQHSPVSRCPNNTHCALLGHYIRARARCRLDMFVFESFDIDIELILNC